MAKRLKMSADEILGLKTPTASCADRIAWQDGDPTADGWYAVKVRIGQTDVIVRKVLWWSDGCWFLNARPDASCLDETIKVVGWFPLPDDTEED